MASDAYITSLVAKSSDQIDAEIFQLYAHDQELEEERSKLVLTNHRQLVDSILKLHTVQSQLQVGVEKLHPALFDKLEDRLSSFQDRFKTYVETVEISHMLERDQELVTQSLTTPLRLKLALQEKDWSECQSISSQFINEIACIDDLPKFIIDLIIRVLRLQERIITHLMKSIALPSRSLSECATDLGYLESTIVGCQFLQTRLARDGHQYESTLNVSEKEIMKKESLEILFVGCWRMELVNIQRQLEMKMSVYYVDTFFDAISILTDYLHGFGLHFSSLFKKQTSYEVSEIYRMATLWIIRMLEKWGGDQNEYIDEQILGNKEFLQKPFAQQLCELMIPTCKSVESQQQGSHLTFMNMAQLLSKTENYLSVMSRLSASSQVLLKPKLSQLIRSKVHSVLRNAHDDFAVDLHTHFDPDHPGHYSRIDPFREDPSINQLQTDQDKTDEIDQVLKQLNNCPPLQLWLNSHLQLLNDCRILVLSADLSFENLLIYGFFESIRSMSLSFRQFCRQHQADRQRYDPTQLNIISEAIGEYAVPALLTAEALFFELPKRFVPEATSEDQHLELVVQQRDGFVRLILDKCLLPQSARPFPRSLRLGQTV